ARAREPRSRECVARRRRGRRVQACGRLDLVPARRLAELRRVALELLPPGAAARRRALLLGVLAAWELPRVVHGASDRRRRVYGDADGRRGEVRPGRLRQERARRAGGGGGRSVKRRVARYLGVGVPLAAAWLCGSVAVLTQRSMQPLPETLTPALRA